MGHRHPEFRKLVEASRQGRPHRIYPGLDHHLQGCLLCQGRLVRASSKGAVERGVERARAHRPSHPSEPSRSATQNSYQHILEQAFTTAETYLSWIGSVRREAPELLASLLRQPWERWPLLVRNGRRYRSWGLVDLLLEESRRRKCPEEVETLVAISLEILDQLEEGGSDGRALVFARDLRARAWACRGSLLGRQGEALAAREAFSQAAELLDEGSGDPLEEAFIDRLVACFLAEQGQTAEALRMLRQVLAIYRRTEEQQHMVEVTGEMIQLLRAEGRVREAGEWVEKVAGWLQPDGSPALYLVLLRQWVTVCEDIGQPELARRLLSRVRRLVRERGDRTQTWRLLWEEGRVARALGDAGRAEKCLRLARKGLRQSGEVADAARACQDLAALYVHQGRSPEARKLAGELLDLPREAAELCADAIAAITHLLAATAPHGHCSGVG